MSRSAHGGKNGAHGGPSLNASFRPSGDQAGSGTPEAIFRSPVPSALIRYRSLRTLTGSGNVSVLNATLVPSGDHSGSSPAPSATSVSCANPAPEGSIVKISTPAVN